MKKVLLLSLALILLLGITSHGTSSYFSDRETSAGNTFTAWVEICPYDSMIIVSDTDTMVTEAYTMVDDQKNASTTTPHDAVLAWQPYDDSIPPNTHWNNSITYNGTPYTFSDGAQWIWETEYTDEPGGDAQVLGRVVRFERTFTIPCSPAGAELYMTVDNGYTVWINGNLVGCAQVDSGETDPCIGWETSNLTEDFVHTSDWMTVETYTIDSTDLETGENVLVILAANEQMDGGTAVSNPAGLIYWLEVEWGY